MITLNIILIILAISVVLLQIYKESTEYGSNMYHILRRIFYTLVILWGITFMLFVITFIQFVNLQGSI